MPRALEVFFQFLRLGTTSFGGPVAHLAYFRQAFVERRAWLDEQTFGECVALTQLLPGPSSSQTGMLIGWLRAGPSGAVAAWAGFTLPSAVLMTLFALAQVRFTGSGGWLHGLLLAAVAVVASAIVGMRPGLAPDPARILLALAVAATALFLPNALTAPTAIALAAVAGAILLEGRVPTSRPKLELHVAPSVAVGMLAMFSLCFVALAAWTSGGTHVATLANVMYRVGSLVFGGGHVVLPLLQTQLANAGIISQRDLLSGYAAVQAMPGPLFTIAAFSGARVYGGSLGWTGAFIATLAIFAPSFLLLGGIAPFYRTLAANERVRCAIAGANAGVLGLLGAAFVTPIFTSTIRSVPDGILAFLAFAAITYARLPSWVIVIVSAFTGYVLER